MIAISIDSSVALWNHQQNCGKDNSLYFQPHSDGSSISDLCWSHGGKLASCASTTNIPDIAITSINNEGIGRDSKPLTFHSTSTKLPDDLQTPETTKSVCFGCKSRFLCVSANRDISIFDLKKEIRARRFSLPLTNSSLPHNTFSSRACVAGSVVVAASNLENALYVYQLKETNTSPTRLCASKGNEQVGCNALCYATQSVHCVAAGMHDGTIDIWDVKKECRTSVYTGGGTIVDMCFSPVNSRLLASCCTGDIFFHDAVSAKSVATIDINDICTSLSLSTDGVSCAVGTSAGAVLLYDLRKPSGVPVTQWSGAKKNIVLKSKTTPVTCVRFQKRSMTLSGMQTKPREEM